MLELKRKKKDKRTVVRKLRQEGPEPGNSPALRRRGPFQKLKVRASGRVRILQIFPKTKRIWLYYRGSVAYFVS